MSPTPKSPSRLPVAPSRRPDRDRRAESRSLSSLVVTLLDRGLTERARERALLSGRCSTEQGRGDCE